MAHTPGPWNVSSGQDDAIITTDDGSGASIAVVYGAHAWRKEWQANARLIASAPDLLATLKALRPLFETGAAEEYAAEIEAAEAAIAKAEPH